MKHLKKGNFAFWRYSSSNGFKPFLAARIVRIHQGNEYPGPGHIVAEGFGAGWFKPSFCLPQKQGEAAAATLDGLDTAYRQEIRIINSRFTAAARAVIPKGIKLSP